MLTKSALQQSMEKLPESFTLDEIVDHLILLDKVNEGLAQSDNDEVYSSEEVKQKLARWFR